MLSQTSAVSFSDYLENKPFVIGQELSTKLHCIRLIIGLHEHQPTDTQFSLSSTNSSSTEDENESRLLGHGCLNYFDKITKIYPFSDVEKSHMRSALKLQVSPLLFTVNEVSQWTTHNTSIRKFNSGVMLYSQLHQNWTFQGNRKKLGLWRVDYISENKKIQSIWVGREGNVRTCIMHTSPQGQQEIYWYFEKGTKATKLE